MSISKRREIFEQVLLEQEMEARPSIQGFVKKSSSNKRRMFGPWENMSDEFELAFIELWDLAFADSKKKLDSPLLFLWRHSVELAIKSAINYLDRGLNVKLNHNIVKLFEKLIELTEKFGLCCDDDHTRNVGSMIKEFYSIDPHADRFRYPESKRGLPHDCVELNLEKLFKSHMLILGWCGGIQVEVETGRLYGLCK